MEGFRKHSTGQDRDYFAIEAAGLRWLAAAGPGSARIVQVLDVDDQHIELERLTPVRPERRAAAEFGRALAVTHQAGADAFGQPPPGCGDQGYIGAQRMSMVPTPTWGAFYAEQRILPYARAAYDLGQLSHPALGQIERVVERLRTGDFDDDRPPARIHGDLWSGNVIFTAAGVVLIDPAAHGGHGLTDLAMLHLFGAPQLDVISAAYAEAAAFDAGWPGLIGLHQLHPLLVHAVSHGAAYGAEAGRVAARYG